jgi:hypothetical protein
MKTKRLILPLRERQLPSHWSWIDHRLVSEDYMSRCEPEAWTLYLFLITVGDAQGLSYYSEVGIARRLDFTKQEVQEARNQLCHADLIAYQKPLYQVLDLGRRSEEESSRTGECVSLGDLLRRAIEKA